jgi:hypothetical protein
VTVLASLFVGFYKVREMIAAGVDKSDVDNSDVEDFDLNKLDVGGGGADKEFLIKY